MSHTKVKTTYSVEGANGSTETKMLYCHHNHGTDSVTFYNEEKNIVSMCFNEWKYGDDLWDAMNRLYYPFEKEWGGKLKKNVQFWHKFDETN